MGLYDKLLDVFSRVTSKKVYPAYPRQLSPLPADVRKVALASLDRLADSRPKVADLVAVAAQHCDYFS